MTVRLDVSENEWRRHNKDMEPQRTGCVRPLHTRKRNRTLGLRKTALASRARSNDWAECRDQKVSAPSRRRNMSLDIPFYRTSPSSALLRHVDYFRVARHPFATGDNCRWRLQPSASTVALSKSSVNVDGISFG